MADKEIKVEAPSTETVEEPAVEPVERPEDLPDPGQLPELRIYSHSTLLYWWPVWAVGYVMAMITYFRGGAIELDQVRQEWFHPSAGLGVTYVLLLVLVILFTNVKLRGIYSVVFTLALVTMTLLFAWLGWWDEILGVVPHLSVHMNMGFYLVFSTALMIVWLLAFFVFDRMVFYRIRPGQMAEEHVIGGGERSYDARGMLVEQHGDDFFRHVLLGLGAGDLKITTSGAIKEELHIPNVTFANRKVKMIQKLVAVEPHNLMPDP